MLVGNRAEAEAMSLQAMKITKRILCLHNEDTLWIIIMIVEVYPFRGL